MVLIATEQLTGAGLADPTTASKVAAHLANACGRFGIDTGLRLAGFLAQCSHESAGFRVTEEHLGYSAERLLQVWPARFDAASAEAYAGQPAKIASNVYASRLGNGDEATGDGWTYRGRGFIQVTGRASYRACGQALGEDLVANPSLLATLKYAALSAAWFWGAHGLNEIADSGDIVAMTKRVNGGVNGLEDRRALYEKARRVFAPGVTM